MMLRNGEPVTLLRNGEEVSIAMAEADPIPDPDPGERTWLEILCDDTIDDAEMVFVGGHNAGKKGWFPGATYGNVWLRDFAMMVRGRPSKFTSVDILNHIDLFSFYQGVEGNIYDAIDPSGGVFMASGAYDAYDNPFELIDLIYSHYQKTGNTTAFETYQATITAALAWVAVDDHLVYIAPEPAPLIIGFGFQDTVRSRGRELMTSVLRYRAHSQLAEMAVAADMPDIYSAELPLIRAALVSHLWDESAGLFRNADLVNPQHSVPGSAYAVVVGAAQGAVADAITATFIAARPGGAGDLAGKGFYQNGQVRHMPEDELWDDTWAGEGTYQNGAYWSTFTGWAAEVLERGQAGLGYTLVEELVTKFQADSPADRPIEASNADNGYTGGTRYCASAAMPLVFMQRLNR